MYKSLCVTDYFFKRDSLGNYWVKLLNSIMILYYAYQKQSTTPSKTLYETAMLSILV